MDIDLSNSKNVKTFADHLRAFQDASDAVISLLSNDPSGPRHKDPLLEANHAWAVMFDKKAADAMHKDPLLAARGARYGAFKNNAKISQALKAVMRQEPKWQALDPDMKEALEMIAHKISRILAGDPYYDDSWVDVAGYATRVADRLKK